MKIEDRMGDFEKVADKLPTQDDAVIKTRMMDFEVVSREKEQYKGDSTLPYGLKRYKECPSCGEFMEIHKIEERKAVYRCKSCEKEVSQSIDH